ncbi:type IV-A pilus assembly ATPase PilB, partial [Vibrio lentus]
MLTNLPTVLRQADLLSLTQEQTIAEHVHASGVSTPEALLVLGIFTGESLAHNIQAIFGLSLVQLGNTDYEALCEQLGLRELISKYRAIPISVSSSTLTLASADPTDLQAEDDFRFATGLQIELVVANYSELE